MAKKKSPAKTSVGKKKSAPAKKAPAKKKTVKSGVAKRGEELVRFEGKLEKRVTSIGGAHYIRVPASVSKFFGAKGSVRVLGTMNGIDVDRALIPNGEGGHEIIMGTDVRKKTESGGRNQRGGRDLPESESG